MNSPIRSLMDKAALITNEHDDNIAAEVPIDVWRKISLEVKRLEDALFEERAKVLHYEHVLEHVCDKHPVPNAPPHTACPECQRMARQALDGEHREEFRDLQRWFDEPD